MKPLDIDELNKIRGIVNGHWTSLGISTFGTEAMGANHPELQSLIQQGIITQQAASLVDPVADAYLFGFMRRKLEQAGHDVLEMSLDEFHEIIGRDPSPLSDAELAAIRYAKKWGGQYARTVAERAAGRVIARIQQADNDSFVSTNRRELIADRTAEALQERWSPDSLAASLRAETGDSVTDWERVAQTEIQNAHEQGVADDIQSDYGPNARVAKLVNPNACKYCKQLYLNEDGVPKIFTLAELRANGDNVGKRKADWVATLGIVHPFCFCELIYIPDGYTFNDSGDLVRIATA